MNKETFLEKFSKIYEYPYGSKFQPKRYKNHDFERYLKRKENYNPFHVDWPSTKRAIWYCSEYTLDPNHVPPFKDIVFRLENYYNGYTDEKEKLCARQLQLERERFMNVTHIEFTHTYDRYLQYLDEQDIIQYENQLKAERNRCSYWHKFYYGNPMDKLNPTATNNNNIPDLCTACCKKYISGFFDSGSENK